MLHMLHAVSPVLLAVPALCVFTGAFVFLALHEWRLDQLRWRNLTVHNCQRYLVARGWTYVGSYLVAAKLDKGPYRVLVDCITSNPATLGSVQAVIEPYTIDRRQPVILVPGAIEPGVVEAMLSRHVIVMCYKHLGEFDSILEKHAESLNDFRLFEQRLLTTALDPPTPSKLLPRAKPVPHPAAPQLNDGLIGETTNVQCFFRDRGTDTLLIAFNDSWRFGPAARVQPRVLMDSLDFSILDFVTREPNWFPANDMASLIPLVLERLDGRFPRRLTFGFSQGGYGALKFSHALGATASLAFSPQYSIDQRLVEPGRFASHFRSHLNVGMALAPGDCTCAGYVFYDPYDPQDRRHVGLISNVIDITEIRMPFAGHATGQIFATPAKLQRLVTAALDQDLDALIRAAAEARHSNPGRSYLMALELAQTKPALALHIADTHGDKWSIAQQPHLCYRLAISGKADAALRWMERLVAAHPENHEINGCAALVALEAKRVDQAAHFAERACTLSPSDARWHHAKARARKLQFDMPT